jgi:hypothetical protein
LIKYFSGADTDCEKASKYGEKFFFAINFIGKNCLKIFAIEIYGHNMYNFS